MDLRALRERAGLKIYRRSTGTRMRGVFNSQLGKKPNLAKDGSLASIPNARFVSM
jgi:hypothetical protein